MTTQRDRLAAVLHDMDVSDGYKTRPTEFYAGLADALLARGVRVVDEETLAAALWVKPDEHDDSRVRGTCRACGDYGVTVQDIDVTDVLAALDGLR